MLATSIFSRVKTAAGHFVKADRGNVAMIFGIAAVPLLSFIGAAIDYSRANAARSSMQAALDSTALMVAKDLTNGNITTSQINAKATAYFNALYNNKDANNVAVTATYTAAAGNGSTSHLAGELFKATIRESFSLQASSAAFRPALKARAKSNNTAAVSNNDSAEPNG